MAKLHELIKGFRANVREGNPCALEFNGKDIHLYPKTSGSDPRCGKTYIGICTKPSKPKQILEDMPDIHTYANTGIPRPEH